MKLTERRLKILSTAKSHVHGLVDRPYMTGFERYSWDRNAEYLVGIGLLKAYVHGGYEITEAGRAALSGDKP